MLGWRPTTAAAINSEQPEAKARSEAAASSSSRGATLAFEHRSACDGWHHMAGRASPGGSAVKGSTVDHCPRDLAGACDTGDLNECTARVVALKPALACMASLESAGSLIIAGGCCMCSNALASGNHSALRQLMWLTCACELWSHAYAHAHRQLGGLGASQQPGWLTRLPAGGVV